MLLHGVIYVRFVITFKISKIAFFNVHASVHRNNILVYNSKKMRK